MKRLIVFSMLVLCLFGAVAVANAATELTDDQMARQFGGTIFDPENYCDYGGFDILTYYWWGLWNGPCESTGHSCDHDSYPYQIVCICNESGTIYYYACASDDPNGLTEYDLQELADPSDYYFIFDENTY